MISRLSLVKQHESVEINTQVELAIVRCHLSLNVMASNCLSTEDVVVECESTDQNVCVGLC